MKLYSQEQLEKEVSRLATDLSVQFGKEKPITVFATSAPYLPIAYMLVAHNKYNFEVTADPKVAMVFICGFTVDSNNPTTYDLADNQEHLLEGCDALLDGIDLSTYQLPWNPKTDLRFQPVAGVIKNLLSYIVTDSDREGLKETPKRVAKAWEYWTSGYEQDPEAILKAFEDGAENCDEMVVVRDIPVYSKCEHHLADIIGFADVAYIPKGKVAGLSKLSRVVNCFARRLQVQERMTNQIADALCDHLSADVAVRVRARHMCMESRGICQQGHHTVTSAVRGAFKNDPSARSEFFSLTDSPKGV